MYAVFAKLVWFEDSTQDSAVIGGWSAQEKRHREGVPHAERTGL